jgi:hypothetical protein
MVRNSKMSEMKKGIDDLGPKLYWLSEMISHMIMGKLNRRL